MKSIQSSLKKWFLSNRRSLPWRENPSPYQVWVAEVMLQQTQVNVVIPYFQRWMKTFPTIQALSEASIDKVIKTWEGLGYYSRARNLHQGTQYITKHLGGILPNSYEALVQIKGLGPYTIGAILSFAFKQKALAIDSNVSRVIARYNCIEEEINKKTTYKKIEKLTQIFLPNQEPWIVMEALIELGALICKSDPKCSLCPIQKGCQAHRKCKADLLPQKRKYAKTIYLHRTVAVVLAEKKVLMRKGKKGKVMQDLWEFPYFDQGVDISQALGISLIPIQKLPQVIHHFTRYKALLYPEMFQAQYKECENFCWVSSKQLKELALSSGHRRILYSFMFNDSFF